jgi:hypothetical protein
MFVDSNGERRKVTDQREQTFERQVKKKHKQTNVSSESDGGLMLIEVNQFENHMVIRAEEALTDTHDSHTWQANNDTTPTEV